MISTQGYGFDLHSWIILHHYVFGAMLCSLLQHGGIGCMVGEEETFFGYARGFNTVCLGQCRDQLYTVLAGPVRDGSPVSSWGPVGTYSGGTVGMVLAWGMMAVPAG